MISVQLDQRRSSGYTLLEMTIVLVLVGVLVGLAPVAWRAWQQSAESRRIQAELIDVISTARSLRRTSGEYPAHISSLAEHRTGKLALIEGYLAADPGTVSVALDPGLDQIGAASMTSGGVCYFIRHVTSGPARGTGYGIAARPDADDCRGELALQLQTVGVDEPAGFGDPVEITD